MKSQRVLLLMVLCATIVSNTFAQVQTPKYITTTANSGGYYEYLPSTYNSDARSYPLIIFLHGLGELGNGTSTDLPKLLNCWYALPRLINDGGFPMSFNVGGQQQGFIVISPQFKAWPSGSDVNDVINYAISNYRVNQNRIYVTGLSMGGGATWDFASAYPTRAAAIVPICGASWPDQGKAQAIASAKLPVWATHNDFDGTVPSSYTKDWITNITNDGGIGKKTIWPVNSHDAWTKTYDPSFKENNLNIYDWMLQYSKSTAVLANMAPTANAGADQVITLPTNTVSLNGTGADSDGTVASYSWSKISGGTATIASPSSATTTVGSLVQGSYVFRLTVTDNKGATASDDVNITVNPEPYSGPSYKIEAENWSAMSGVNTESCSDAGGTLDVGWIDLNDWMDYTFSVPAAGTYTINLRLANPYTGSKFQIKDSTGLVLATVNVPVTGGFQTWQTVPVTINFSAGNQLIRLQSISSTGWNINWLEVLGGEAPNQSPKANAGVDKAVTLPTNSVTLNGIGSDPDGSIASFNWTKISGGNAIIETPSTASTRINSLEPGTYVFRFTVTDNKGASSWDEVSIMVSDVQTGSSSPTANDFESYNPYEGKYGYGLNPGWYGSNWSTQQIVDLGAGNNVKGIGGKAFRMQIYDNYMGWYGDSSLIGDYEHLQMLGSTETTVMIGGPRDANKWDTAFYSGTDSKAKVFKGLYEPIFINGEVNPKNTFAAYLYKVVKIYGKYIKFYEVWNEPDFTYGDGGWLGDSNPPNPNSWFFHDPTPEDLVNLRTPVQYYIRMLRISWEVIKKYQPNAYVCTGGIGNRSFLDALLRNSDNPDGGKVTNEFPLKGGAYFDILSFHTYPEFLLRNWAEAGEPASADGFYYYRHSDSAIAKHLMIKNRMDALLHSYGYDASNYPAKQFICTETGMSRQTDASQFGGNEVQRNYMIKAHVKTQMDGQIKQTYWFSSADGVNAATDHWDAFGCYYYFGDKQPYNATPTDQGIAMKTTSDLLYGRTYDASRTAAINLPASIDGGAFKGNDGSYVYVLWAKTSTDLSEKASGKISFPASIISSGYVVKKDWNFSSTDSSTILSSANVELTGAPAFFLESQVPAANQLPVVNAGVDQTITLPKDSTTLSGTATDADGTIASYSWSQLTGPAQSSLSTPSGATTLVKSLVEGSYQFELKVTDNGGAVSKDTVIIVVKAAANQLPVVNAGVDQTITLPKDSTTLSGTATDADGTIASYSWSQLTGPAQSSLSTPSGATTLVKSLVEGSYQFELKVTDNGGAVSKDTVIIVVKAAANQLPVVNAGVDQTITLPVNNVTLNGSATDKDGSIVSYNWTKLSGPSSYTISSPATASTSVIGLVQGIYIFRLSVKDNNGATSSDDIQITVNAVLTNPNQAPVAMAGKDIVITLPVNKTQLSGSGTDSDGTIVGYRWTKIDGPVNYSLSAPTTNKTNVTNLVEGVYSFQLTVTDNQGATGSDTVMVTVKPDTRKKSTAALYPNPATSTLNVSIDAVTIKNYSYIRIYNSMGHIVYQEEFLRTQQQMVKSLDISSLDKGVYMININPDINTTLTMKFIKE
jgi:pimeloyl-ACP methyl ester carboxylesterase